MGRTVGIVFSLLAASTLAGCPADRGGGGDPPVCGSVLAGGACVMEDACGCGLSCIAGTCMRIVDPPGAGPGSNVPAPTPLMVKLCNEVAMLPCGDDDPDCPEELSEQRAELEEAGCGTRFDALLMCYDRNALVCEDGDVALPMECAAEIMAVFSDECLGCGTSVECSPIVQPPPPIRDAGSSTTSDRDAGVGGEPAFTCQTAYATFCENEPDTRADLSCRREVTTAGMIWVCNCDTGLRPDTQFGVRSNAETCCDFAAIAETMCGLAPR